MGKFTANINVEPYTNVLIEGDSPEEVAVTVASPATLALAQQIKTFTAALKIAEQIPGTTVVATPAAVSASPAPAAQQQYEPPAPAAPAAPSQPAPAAAQASGPSCVHGPRVFRTGTSAKGTWQAYFCPTPKGTPDQCKPNFL